MAYTCPMKCVRHIVLCAALALPATVQAEEAPAPQDSTPFFDMIEGFLRGFLRDVEPQMRQLERGFEEMEPELERFMDQMRAMTQFHPPVVLPNGDILIRRRQSGDDEDEAPVAPDDSDAGPFEL